MKLPYVLLCIRQTRIVTHARFIFSVGVMSNATLVILFRYSVKFCTSRQAVPKHLGFEHSDWRRLT